MNSEMDQELARFASLFLEDQGAVVQRTAQGFEALLPDELSRFLGTPEHIRMGKEIEDESPGTYAIRYGSLLLEKMVNSACSKIPLLACELQFDYLKGQGFDRLIREQFKFHKSVGTVEGQANVRTDYLLLTSRYRAQSDEQKEGLLQLTFNLETGALIPRMAEMLSHVVKRCNTPLPRTWDERQVHRIPALVRSQAEIVLLQELGTFQQSMTRRFRRDIVNLQEYYGALKGEMMKGLERPGLSDELVKDRKEKIALLPEELRRKRGDLFKKYSIQVKTEPCAMMLITTPAVKILYRLAVGRNRKNLSLIYNPVTRSMDPLICQGCAKAITSAHFCDRLHLLCTICRQKCPLC